jgi:hypothetical protein
MKRILCLLLIVAPGIAHADKNFLKGKGATWDCKKDPVVNINHGKGTYTFKGACDTINLNGGNSKLTVESVDSLNINGGNNTITVGTLGAANLMGSKNKLTYRTAKEGDSANINSVGAANVVEKTGGTATGTGSAGAAAPTTAPAAGGGTTIDCAKTPSFSYQKNEGSFTFTGACDKISLTGNANQATIDSVKTLQIMGNENKATVTAVDSISTPGNRNTVTYKKAVTANTKTKVSNLGNENKVSVVK